MKPLLIGESPSERGDRWWRHPLSGAPSVRICEALGIELPTGHRDKTLTAYMEMLRRFDTANTLQRWPGKTWPADKARESIKRMYVGCRSAVVLLGRRPAIALGLGEHECWSRARLPEGAEVWLAPHTSGLSRLWNDSETLARFGRVLREAIELARVDDLRRSDLPHHGHYDPAAGLT